MLDQVWKRLQLAFSPGALQLASHEKAQTRLLSDEVLDNIHRVEPYGLSYRPLAGAQCYVLFPAGDRSTGFAVVIGDNRYEMTLAEGEVALHDHKGNHVLIRPDTGEIVVTAEKRVVIAAGEEVIVDAPILRVTGDILDQSEGAGKTMDAMRQTYNTHTHHENDASGETETPTQTM
jgi:phage baseplate assembly protein V